MIIIQVVLAWHMTSSTILHQTFPPVFAFFPSFSLPGMLWDPTNSIWRQRTLFQAMTGHIAFIDCLIAEVFRGFPHL